MGEKAKVDWLTVAACFGVAALLALAAVAWSGCTQMEEAATAVDPYVLSHLVELPKAGALACTPPPGYVLAGVTSPLRLLVLQPCGEVSGRVTYVTKESDGDFHVGIKPDNPDVLTTNNKGVLVAEIVPAFPMPALHAGDYVAIAGPVVMDLSYGWIEVHPVRKVLGIAHPKG